MTTQDYLLAVGVGVPVALAAFVPLAIAARLAAAFGLRTQHDGIRRAAFNSFVIVRNGNPYPKSRLFRVVYVLCGFLWGTSIGVRSWGPMMGFETGWTLGLAPSFFAGVGLTIMAALALQLRPLFAFVYGASLMVLAEVVQLWLSKYVFDPLDVLAGVMGAALATLLLAKYSDATLRVPETT